MLRKVRHLGRKAAKYHFVIALHQLTVKGTKSWQPHKLVVVLSRRKKKVPGTPQSWRPSIEDPYKGCATWSGHNQETLEFNVTLFEEHNLTGYEPKNWVFAIENEARDGKRKPIATLRVDLAQFVANASSSHDMDLNMKTLTAKVKYVSLNCSISCSFLSSGPATEADLVSLAGSTASEDTIRLGDIDVANVHDLDLRDFDNSHRSSLIGEANESSSMNQELKNLTSQIESLNFATEEVPTGDAESGKEKSHRSSVCSAASEHPSAGASSFAPSKGRSNSEAGNSNDDNSSQLNESNHRSSITSDSSDNSLQKRRLRPSADFLPAAFKETEVSSANTSPAPAVQKTLLRWCQKVTASYEGVKVTNFTTSWRNGLALCAVLHHYKPELIDFENFHALNGKRNVKKAIEGFKELNIGDHLSTFSISNKNDLISLLVSVRKFFNEDETPLDSTDDSSSLDSKSSFTGSNPKISHVPSRNLRGSTKIKLLSDLQEKEMEDDVFSSALDDALEQNLSPDAQDKTDKISNNSDKLLITAKSEKVADGIEKSVFIPNPKEIEENTLSNTNSLISPKREEFPVFPAEQSENTKVTIIPTVTNPTTVPLDIVLSSLIKETDKVPSDIEATGLEQSPFHGEKDTSETEKVDFSEAKPGNGGTRTPFDEDIESVSKSATYQNENSKPNLYSNPFEEDVVLEHKKSDPVLDRISSKDNVSSRETDLAVSIHLPSSSDDVDESLRNSDASLSNLSSTVQPEVEEYKASVNSLVVETKLKNENLVQEMKNEVTELENQIRTSTLDVAVKLSSECGDFNGQGDKENDFQKAVQKLLQSSAERNRKAKALEVIAQTKADMTSSKVVGPSEEEIKRREIIEERAQKLLEKTRATLNRQKQQAECIELNNDSHASSFNVSNEFNHNSPLKFSLSSPKSTSSAVKLQTSEDKIDTTQSSLILNSDEDIASNERNTNDEFNPFYSESTNVYLVTSSHSPSLSHDKEEQSNSVLSSESCSDKSGEKEEDSCSLVTSNDGNEVRPYRKKPLFLSEELSQNVEDASSSPSRLSSHSPHETKEEQPFTDPLNAFGADTSTFQDSNSSLSSKTFDPLASISNPTSHQKNIPTKQLSTENQKENSFQDDIPFTDPLSMAAELSPYDEKVIDESASNDARPSSSVFDKLSTSEANEVERRWSSMLKKSTSSVPANEISEIEAEKRALETEQRLVEERANEVRLDIQDAKKMGGRANRRRETDLTQEWFQLVNKKNAILRQQDLLGLREEEQIILNQVEALHEELIPLMTTEESMKTLAQKEKEMKLLEEKVRLVNERDKIIQLMNEKEKSALDEEERIQTNLEANMTKMMQQDEKCFIM